MATRDLPRFGDLVRRHRTAAALSQEALAERAGLSARAVSDLERGVHRAPRLETVRMLADALGLAEAERANLLAAARPAMTVTKPAGADGLSRLNPLPIPPTRLIGREAEVAAFTDLLAHHEVRLVTLTGPGGTGKTHLALAVAAEVRDRYPDGVSFVDLSPLTDPALVVPAIATALGVREIAGESLRETLGRRLRDRRLLLVLDNCEQVLGAASDIASLLAACQNLEILATSREPLHIRAERELAVAPLPLPDPDRLPPPVDLARIPAVALFVERAQAASAGFSLSADNAVAVAGICQRLDGLPLAIELAAARIKALPPAVLLTRLEQRLPLLTRGARDLPARQRTMRDAIAWSYDLLHEEERGLFRRLSVFAGGFTLEAAAAVSGDEAAVLDGIATLVGSSLLQSETTDGAARYAMLETIREFGLERLHAAGEAEAAQHRHAAYVLAFVERWLPDPPLPGEPRRIAAIGADYDNIRLALARLADHQDAVGLARLTGALFDYWYAQGLYREGRQWLQQALSHRDAVPPPVHLRVLGTAGALALVQGNLAEASRLSAVELPLARALGNEHRLGVALFNAALLAQAQEDYAAAERWMREAYDLAHGWTDASIAAPIAGIALGNLGIMASAQGHLDRSLPLFTDAIAILREVTYPWPLANALCGLGGVLLRQGRPKEAAPVLLEALDAARQAQDPRWWSTILLAIAGLAMALSRLEEGARLLGAADALATKLRAPFAATDVAIRALTVSRLTTLLEADHLAQQRRLGETMTMTQAITDAELLLRELLAHIAPAGATAVGLTLHEREVLRLLERGWTDRQIAEALLITRKTASNHVANILSKLGTPTRQAAVRRGRDLGELAPASSPISRDP